jgi:hypothetical protein
MNTNKILNLSIIKNLYINSLIDTINSVAYKKIKLIQLIDSLNHVQQNFINDIHMQRNQVHAISIFNDLIE